MAAQLPQGDLTPIKPRLLVVVISMRPEATLERVLDRVPRSIPTQYDCEVLVVDDAPEESCRQIGERLRAQHPELALTLLRNQHSQGYGGTQKIAFAYAAAEKFDFVALLHADGGYAPEALPDLLEPLRSRQADAVLGSRMMKSRGALHRAMPLYKVLGNRLLSFLQNRMLGTRLSELHSGYRLYAVAALEAIPYRLNSNGFLFDTEILLQLLNARRRIVELPIPAYAGGEIGLWKGLGYAKDVVLATLHNGLHRAGLLYQRRFDPGLRQPTHYDLKLGYGSSHSWALDAVPEGAAVLDLGAGSGGLARQLLEKKCKVGVVDQYHVEGAGDAEVVVQDLDEPLRFDVRPYRYLLLLDIIEHLRDPELFLERLRAQFDHQPRTLILTTPNVAFFVQRIMLLLGQFNYGKSGILDRTHTRLFTFRSARQMMRDAGFRIKRIRGVPAPFPKVWGGALGRAAVAVNLALIHVSKTLFAYQFFVEAESTPGIDFLLQNAKATARGLEAPENPPTGSR